VGTVSPVELEGWAVYPRWKKLDAVVAWEQGLSDHLRANLGGWKYDQAGMCEGGRLTQEFNAAWPHRIPLNWELVLANREGKLEETIAQLNSEFQCSIGVVAASQTLTL
jgi:hypothetical protein